MMMNARLYHDVESSSSYNGYDDINNSSDINKRKRQEDDSEYDDESDYEQESRERPTRRAVGRPKGSKNKPKSVPIHYDHNNQHLHELPRHVPSLVLSSYTTAVGETFDIMIKVSENMSLESLKQECEARGYTYKKSKSVTKEDLLFLLGPGTIASHMTKVYDDYQILTGRLKEIDQENERIKAENDKERQQRLKNIREEARSVSNSTSAQRNFLDQQSRERLEREQREVMPPNHQMWVPPVLPNGYPVNPNGLPPVANGQSPVSNGHPAVPNGYQMPPGYFHHMYPNMPNMPSHMYPNHQMWGMPYHPNMPTHMYPNQN